MYTNFKLQFKILVISFVMLLLILLTTTVIVFLKNKDDYFEKNKNILQTQSLMIENLLRSEINNSIDYFNELNYMENKKILIGLINSFNEKNILEVEDLIMVKNNKTILNHKKKSSDNYGLLSSKKISKDGIWFVKNNSNNELFINISKQSIVEYLDNFNNEKTLEYYVADNLGNIFYISGYGVLKNIEDVIYIEENKNIEENLQETKSKINNEKIILHKTINTDLGINIYTVLEKKLMYNFYIFQDIFIIICAIVILLFIFWNFILKQEFKNLDKLIIMGDMISKGGFFQFENFNSNVREFNKAKEHFEKTSTNINYIFEEEKILLEKVLEGNIKSQLSEGDLSGKFYNIVYNFNEIINNITVYFDAIDIPIFILNDKFKITYLNNQGKKVINKFDLKEEKFIKFIKNNFIKEIYKEKKITKIKKDLEIDNQKKNLEFIGIPLINPYNNIENIIVYIIDYTAYVNVEKLNNNYNPDNISERLIRMLKDHKDKEKIM